MEISWIDAIAAALMAIPFGLLFPVRRRYIIIDLIAATVFFPSLSLVRWIEGSFTGQILGAGILYIIFLASAYIASLFNKEAQAKEDVIKNINKL